MAGLTTIGRVLKSSSATSHICSVVPHNNNKNLTLNEMAEHTVKFDKELKKIEHYDRFPSMLPYVGINYGKNDNPKILLIGESNYLPDYSKIHKKAEKWFQSTEQDLNDEEIDWIHCRQLLECDWTGTGHVIYSELNRNLEKHFEIINDKRAITNIAYMNGFQRPSPIPGESIKEHLSQLDTEVSSDVISQVVKIVKPDVVIFVSKFAWEILSPKLHLDENVKIDYTCHPGTGGLYWHNKDYKHGKKKFNKIVKSSFKN